MPTERNAEQLRSCQDEIQADARGTGRPPIHDERRADRRPCNGQDYGSALKKGYLVGGVGAKKKFIPIGKKSTK